MTLWMEEQYKESNIALAIEAITEDIIVEHESHIGENIETTETIEDDKYPSSLSPTLE